MFDQICNYIVPPLVTLVLLCWMLVLAVSFASCVNSMIGG